MYPWEFTLILHLQRCLLWSQGLLELLKKNMEQRREFVLAKSRGESISPSVFPQHLCDVSPCEQRVFAILSTILQAQLCLSSVTSRAGLGHIQWTLVPREVYHIFTHQSWVPEWIWDNSSRGICFVWINIFEPQESSAELIPELSVMTVSPGKASSGEKVSDVCTGRGGSFFFSQCQKARWGERARHMSRVALSHSDPQMQFGPLFLLVEVRAAFESSELKMRAGLIRNTETNPVYWGYRTVRVQSCLNPVYCSVNFILWMDMP